MKLTFEAEIDQLQDEIAILKSENIEISQFLDESTQSCEKLTKNLEIATSKNLNLEETVSNFEIHVN